MSGALRPLDIVRWLLLGPAMVSAWVAVFLLGVLAYTAVEGTCPPEAQISGTCMDAGIVLIQKRLMWVFAGLSAFVVLLVAVLVAPSHRRAVAWAVLVGGLLVAAWMARGGSDGPALFASAAGGGVLALGLSRALAR